MQPNAGGRTSDGPTGGTVAFDLLEGSPYKLLGTLGEGGMGEVFEAEHRALGHRVVVKVLRTELAGRPDLHDRMRVEGQALARIRHPHLVMVTDFGQTRSGRPYVVMERLAGRSLREELMARSVLPVAEAIEIARQMLLGLGAAHAAGLVHRDIKPDNVFLCATEDGRPFVKILDFGVVKIVQAGRDPRTPAPLQVPTSEGVSLGTPRYFSPEQSRGQGDLDGRSDLYAVGLVLYGMVVGRGPFDHHGSYEDLFRAHVSELPMPPSASAPQSVPWSFERLLMRSLEKHREDRFPDALTFAAELGRVLAALGPEGLKFGGASPVLVGPYDGRGLAEATTAQVVVVPAVPVVHPGDPTATASPAVEGGGSELRSTSRKLSDKLVVLDGMVERVLSNPPEHVVKERLSRSDKIDRTAIDAHPPAREAPQSPARDLPPLPSREPSTEPPATVKMAAYPAAPAPSALAPSPSAPAARRSNMPETVPMLDLSQSASQARPAPLVAPAAGDPSASPGFTIPLPTLRSPAKRAAWQTPALIGALFLVLAGLVLALFFLRR